jgi:uncharacterized protein (TIRG00374 family)
MKSKLLNKNKIYLAILIGLSISGYLVYAEVSKTNFIQTWETIHFSFQTFIYLSLAILMMVFRDLGYVLRIRLLTDKKLNWLQSIKVILMWEFASAVSPGVVGGSAVAMFILKKEKINLGKSTAIVFTTALLDNLFYIIAIPIIVSLIEINELLPVQLHHYLTEFWIGYAIILAITLTLFTSLFIQPQLIKKLLLLLSKLPFLSRYKNKANQTGTDIITASKVFRKKPVLFWVKLIATTIFSWSSRFLVVNFILMAFVVINIQTNLLIFAKQLVMWLILLVSPTPGGSGVAEYLFDTFLSEFIPAGALIIITSIIWRLISYYPYLFIGAFILPKWIGRKD